MKSRRLSVYEMPKNLRVLFKLDDHPPFNMKDAYIEATRKGKRPKAAIDASLDHHVKILAGRL